MRLSSYYMEKQCRLPFFIFLITKKGTDIRSTFLILDQMRTTAIGIYKDSSFIVFIVFAYSTINK